MILGFTYCTDNLPHEYLINFGAVLVEITLDGEPAVSTTDIEVCAGIIVTDDGIGHLVVRHTSVVISRLQQSSN